MPHVNGKIYIDSSVTPNIGISIRDDVATVITHSTGEIGRLCGNYDSSGQRISPSKTNYWAKYKPVSLPLIDTASQTENDTVNNEIKWKSDSTWWRASDNFCGISIPLYGSPDELDGETAVWEYNPPSGNISAEPFRAIDFLQYDNDAIAPYEIRIPDNVVRGTAGARPKVTLSLLNGLSYGNLSLTDIKNFSNSYFGIAMFKTGSQTYYKTAESKIGTRTVHNIDIGDIPLFSSDGNVRIYAFIGGYLANNNTTTQYEHTVYFLNTDDVAGYANVPVSTRAENKYKIVMSGLTHADSNCWVGKGLMSAYISGGYIYGSCLQKQDMSNTYELSSVDWNVYLNDGSQRVPYSSGNVFPISGNANPEQLERIVETPGSSINFSSVYDVGSLPVDPSNPSQYYEIIYTFNYSSI